MLKYVSKCFRLSLGQEQRKLCISELLQECVDCKCSDNNNAALCKLSIQTENSEDVARELVKPVRTCYTVNWAKSSHA